MCPDCSVPLSSTKPEPERGERFVEVLRTADASLLPVVESVLSGAGIRFLVQGGETLGGLYPLGAMGGDDDPRLLAAVVRVPASSREAAEALLSEAGEGLVAAAGDEEE